MAQIIHDRSFWMGLLGVVVGSMLIVTISSGPIDELRADTYSKLSMTTYTNGISEGPSYDLAQILPDRFIPFQAYLTDTDGRPIQGLRCLKFQIYDKATGDTHPFVWDETRENVPVDKGMVNVVLGSVVPFPQSATFDSDLFVNISIGVTCDELKVLEPRQQIIPAIHAVDASRANHALEADHADRADDANKLNGQSAAELVPPGTIVAFGGKQEPTGWLFCDGDIVSADDFPSLFAAISTSWGCGSDISICNDSSPNFHLPDLRGQFLRGVDDPSGVNPAGIDPDALSRKDRNGRTVGGVVGSSQLHRTAIPTNPFRAADTESSHTHRLRISAITRWNGGDRTFPAGGDAHSEDWEGPTTLSGEHEHTVVGGDTETRPVNSYVNYIIKY